MWMKKCMQRFRNLSSKIIILHISAKFVFGLGLGLLIAHYFSLNLLDTGLVLIILSIIMSIPGAYKILKGK